MARLFSHLVLRTFTFVVALYYHLFCKLCAGGVIMKFGVQSKWCCAQELCLILLLTFDIFV